MTTRVSRTSKTKRKARPKPKTAHVYLDSTLAQAAILRDMLNMDHEGFVKLGGKIGREKIVCILHFTCDRGIDNLSYLSPYYGQ
jgi:hypothetical protein